MITIDFETAAIEDRPRYPPKPVGVSVMFDGAAPRYYAWGHPSENNCTEKEAKQLLMKIWKGGEELLFHNSKFDVDVAEEHLGLPRLKWHYIHDTLFLIYLHDPHAHSLSLKPSAKALLGMEPVEQDAVRAWLVSNRIVRSNDSRWGACISLAPGNLVGTYAKGDVVRTYKLFKKLYKEIKARNMLGAYDRERRLMPILLDNERYGIRVDTDRLGSDIPKYEECLKKADIWVRRKLRTSDLNLDSDAELAAALDKAGVVEEWVLTDTGQKSVSKKNLRITDKKLASVLGYRTRLTTCISTFAVPWYAKAIDNGGRICTSWNQVRGEKYGTRTGRPSTSNPNFLNVPKNFTDKGDGYQHPSFLPALIELPLMRTYLLPDEGHVWMHRDYNQQELRIVAHYEDGLLLKAYNDDHDLDTHTYVQGQIKELTGIELPRTPVKNLNFGYVYGMGLKALSERLDVSYEDAKRLRNAQMAALPGLAALSKDIKNIAGNGLPIRTWGGREYYPEAPKELNGRMTDFIYKLLNYLVQGSAADATKEAVIRYNDTKEAGRFLVTVYDEINISAPKRSNEMEILRGAMEGLEFDLPMKSDGKVGSSWGSLSKAK